MCWVAPASVCTSVPAEKFWIAPPAISTIAPTTEIGSVSSSSLTPYMSIGLDINHVSIEDAGDDTETDIVARFGLEWEATRKFAIMGELGVGDPANDFILGVNVPF